jgi:ribosomal protein S18 acetylase RimI-like enzyme
MVLRRAQAEDVEAFAQLQRAAYAELRERVGTTVLPYDADFAAVIATMEVWLGGPAEALETALVLRREPDHLLVWSIAVAPALKGRRLGSALLDFAEERARQAGLDTVRLFTNERFVENVAWYQRRGYGVERIEQRPDRRVVHFVRTLA